MEITLSEQKQINNNLASDPLLRTDGTTWEKLKNNNNNKTPGP